MSYYTFGGGVKLDASSPWSRNKTHSAFIASAIGHLPNNRTVPAMGGAFYRNKPPSITLIHNPPLPDFAISYACFRLAW